MFKALNKLFADAGKWLRPLHVKTRNPSRYGSAYHKIDYSHTADAKHNRVSQKKRRLYARRAGKRVGQ